MNSRLDRFNTLPPKPEYSRKVLAVLRSGKELRLTEIVAATGLSNTQVLCALDPMVRERQVSKNPKVMAFSLTEKARQSST